MSWAHLKQPSRMRTQSQRTETGQFPNSAARDVPPRGSLPYGSDRCVAGTTTDKVGGNVAGATKPATWWWVYACAFVCVGVAVYL